MLDCQVLKMCIVTGPKIDLAVALIDRKKKLFGSCSKALSLFVYHWNLTNHYSIELKYLTLRICRFYDNKQSHYYRLPFIVEMK